LSDINFIILELATVLSFVPMSTLDPMVALRDLVLSPSSLLMMLATQFNNSMAMIGKVALSKFVKIVSLAPVLDSVDVEASQEAEADLAVVSAVAVAASEAVMEEVVLLLALMLPLQRPTHSPTMLPLVLTEARLSTSAM